MYSLNVPVPTTVSRLARGLATDLREATPRDRHTLVLKRLDDEDPRELAREVREAAAGTQPFEARVTGVDAFQDPTTGRGPVAYLRVDSPPLVQLHRRLCDRFGAVESLEDDAYVPHVTVARGGDADRLVGRDVDVTWTVDSLFVWAAEYDEPTERLSLPL